MWGCMGPLTPRLFLWGLAAGSTCSERAGISTVIRPLVAPLACWQCGGLIAPSVGMVPLVFGGVCGSPERVGAANSTCSV